MDKRKYYYETHLHTYPVSKCATARVRESLEFYKSAGYTGVFITNHFLDGNINIARGLPYEERIRFYFSDYYEGARIGEEIGLDVFLGVEMSDMGTDFLIYGLSPEWYFTHPEIEGMDRVEQLRLLSSAGALIIHAHPFRGYDCIKLFPKFVHGAETYNASRTDFENEMAELYAEKYDLIRFAGTDNHRAGRQESFGGIKTNVRIANERDFCTLVLDRDFEIFAWSASGDKSLIDDLK